MLGVWGAVICVGDDIPFIRMKRDSSRSWSSIRVGFKELQKFEIDISDLQSKISLLDDSEEGFDGLIDIVKRNLDLSPYGIPVALFAQERGMRETIAGKFRRVTVYFGVINRQKIFNFVEDMALLHSWVREYRRQFYVTKGLKYILVAFVIQLIAALVPAKAKKETSGYIA